MRSLISVSIILTIAIVAAGAAQEQAQVPAKATSDTYVATGVLVSFDNATQMMTAKARVLARKPWANPDAFRPATASRCLGSVTMLTPTMFGW